MTPETKQAAKRAADWLRAHPKQHIQFELARTKGGRAVDPTHPDACKFCAVGRFALELGMKPGQSPYNVVSYAVPDIVRFATLLFNANDFDKSRGIARLEEIAT